MPKKYNQADLILAVLQSRGPTTTDIFEYMGVKSPSAVIHRLKKDGYKITSKGIWKKTFKSPEMILQAEYTLHIHSVNITKLPLFSGTAKGGM